MERLQNHPQARRRPQTSSTSPGSSATSTSRDQPDEAEQEKLRRLADLLATILDRAIPIPGTSMRIGLDPLLGLVPGIGDAIANAIGSSILILGTRLGIPRIVLVRMSVNMFLNGAIGAIPMIGDLFSVWFQSNARNAALLRRHSQRHLQAGTAADWLFVLGLSLTTLAAMAAVIVGLFWIIDKLWHLAAG